jgi:DNA processing protein
MTSTDELKYWIGFSRIPGIGRVRIFQLKDYFGNLEAAWGSTEGQLKQAGLDSKSIEAFLSLRPEISPDSELERLEHYKIIALACDDPGYPQRLLEIYDYPPVLFIRGNPLSQEEPYLAIVGTRRPSIYGRQVTEEIVRDLAQCKTTIVSGLARGIDSIAHLSTLDVKGKTIAVLASGLDIIYPPENNKLAQRIMEQGTLVSEYPPGIRPKPENFPMRNRIMSGLSLGVLVIEAGQKSGALITALQALEQNREVFAIPGSILSPTSKGTNHLIQQGAKLVCTCNDILEELNLAVTIPQQLSIKEIMASNDSEAAILKQLGAEPVYIDEICRRSGLNMAEVSSTLAMLELKGTARQIGNLKYILAQEMRQNIQ